MKVKAITMPKEKAEQEWKEYRELLKTRSEKYLKELKTAYYYLSKGKKILDIHEVFKATGVNDKKEPKLAIAPASCRKIYFEKLDGKRGGFTSDNPRRYWLTKPEKQRLPPRYDVRLPKDTFVEWDLKEDSWGNAENKVIEAAVPIISRRLLPKGKLSNYYVLWEVESWDITRPPRDPILLKRLSRNLFAVLTVWKLTKLERAIITGRI